MRWLRWGAGLGGALVTGAVLLLASLELFYRHQLAQVPELPNPPSSVPPLPLNVSQAVAATLGVAPPLRVEPLGAWDVAWEWVRSRPGRMPDAGFSLGYAAAGQWLRRFELPAQPTHWRRWALAIWMTRHLSAEQVLALWADTVRLPSASPGLGSAAQAYFERPLSGLQRGEAALLVGNALGPIAFDARCNPARAREVRDRVLQAMRRLGTLNDEEVQRSLVEPIELSARPADAPPCP